MNNISPATHTWTGSGFRVKKCKCGRQTTGKVKNVKSGKSEVLCSECAFKKGFR